MTLPESAYRLQVTMFPSVRSAGDSTEGNDSLQNMHIHLEPK